jgi:hypothetical protein
MSRITVSLESTSLDYINVYWETPYGADTSYTVLRGEAQSGPFDPVTEPLFDRYHIRDYIAPRKYAWRTLHYVVEATQADGTVTRSEPKTLRARPPLDALEMIRLNGLLFREYTGRPCLIYAKRTFGEHCSVCYDEVTHLQLTKNCTSCYGTGFARGYHFPIYAYVNVGPDTQAIMASEQLVMGQSTVQGRMSVYPLVKPGDLLVEREGVHWRVQNVSCTERLRAPVQQVLILFRIPEGDIEYQIPVRWDNEVVTSPRSFSTRSDV